MSKIFKPKYSNRIYYFSAGFGMYLLGVLKQVLAFRIQNDVINLVIPIVMISYTIFLTNILFKNTLYSRLLCLGILNIVSIITDILTVGILYGIIRIPINEITSFGTINVLASLFARLCYIIICEMIFTISFRKLISRLLYNKEIVPLILSNIILVVPSVAVFNNKKLIGSNVSLLFFFLLEQFLLVGITIYVIVLFDRRQQREFKNTLRLQQMELEMQMNKDIIEVTDKLRELRHDMRSHYGLIKSLVISKKYNELESYINDLYVDIEVAEDIFLLDNKNVAILLNQKKKAAKQLKIKFSSTITVNDFKMSDVDICSLLSNLLNNAIEANENVSVEQRFVNLDIQLEEAGYYIICNNSLADMPVFRKGSFITTKLDSSNHGLGVNIIRNIVKKYHGNVKFDFNENEFTVEIFIPNAS
ncbi:sensor histidine kinase [Anaeromicropila populeti]|uniref:GHKL domain-containing protein n=1 Tax=Anaeromicropila populeti TaxID=37658 RepID=A0A1I6IR88_9FIRM|nr:GHKL domain-containing protein [Anaeromicropila populeti]SFR69226.1 GHKL domain-containing protein [Anaeromicropila populeti]